MVWSCLYGIFDTSGSDCALVAVASLVYAPSLYPRAPSLLSCLWGPEWQHFPLAAATAFFSSNPWPCSPSTQNS